MENIEKKKIINEEIEKFKKEILQNEDEIIKIKKDQEKNNKKIAIRRNNIELLKGKIALKELEKRYFFHRLVVILSNLKDVDRMYE